MKKLVIFALLCIAFSGCQNKQEPKSGMGAPAAPLISQDTIRLAREAVKADPKNIKAWIELGNIMMDMKNFNEAIEAYQKALEINPKVTDVIVDLGTCYRNGGRPNEAVKEYRKALEIDPNHPFAHMNLGIVYAFDLNDKTQAIKEFEKYLQLAPNAQNAGQVRQQIQRLKTSS